MNPLLKNTLARYEVMAKSTALDETYISTIRTYVSKITNDELNGPKAMREAIRSLTNEGITTVDHNGRKVRMDTSVRNSLMTEFTHIVQDVQDQVAEELGFDGVEISIHSHSAPDHEPFQGHTFTNEEFAKLQNGEIAEDIEGEEFQTDRPIGMWNCRHLYFGVLIGISQPSMSKSELEYIKAENEAGIEFHGKHYTLYEAEQLQRIVEHNIRIEKANLNLYKNVRFDDSVFFNDYRKHRDRLTELQSEYRELGKVLEPVAMRMKYERATIPKGSTGGLELQPIKRNIHGGITSDFMAPVGVGAMATRFYVKTGMKTQYDNWHVPEGSYVSGVKIIAKGTGKNGRGIDDVNRLVITYKQENGSLTNPEDWHKMRGTGKVTDGQVERMCELHWYQCKNIGRREMKVTRYHN